MRVVTYRLRLRLRLERLENWGVVCISNNVRRGNCHGSPLVHPLRIARLDATQAGWSRLQMAYLSVSDEEVRMAMRDVDPTMLLTNYRVSVGDPAPGA